MTADFKKKGFKHLIRSPIGCVRDQIKLNNFISKLSTFQLSTEAEVTTDSYNQNYQRTLRRGMTHEQFQSPITEQTSKADKVTASVYRGIYSQTSPSPWHSWGSPQLQSSHKKLTPQQNYGTGSDFTQTCREGVRRECL